MKSFTFKDINNVSSQEGPGHASLVVAGEEGSQFLLFPLVDSLSVKSVDV